MVFGLDIHTLDPLERGTGLHGKRRGQKLSLFGALGGVMVGFESGYALGRWHRRPGRVFVLGGMLGFACQIQRV